MYVSKPIFPNQALNAFVSCVRKPHFIQGASSALLIGCPSVPHSKGGERRQAGAADGCGQC